MPSSTYILPLHSGKAPKWLFDRMVRLSGEIVRLIVEEHGQKELVARISNGFWFQALGCVLGFDWHSSGLTSTTLGALRLALEREELGIKIVGGKGQAHKIEENLFRVCDNLGISSWKAEDIFEASRLVAKIDSACLQDGYELYIHSIIVSEKGDWAIVQQGMNIQTDLARRYHFHHTWPLFPKTKELAAARKEAKVLNLTQKHHEEIRKAIVDALKDGEFVKLPKHHFIRSSDLSPRDLRFLHHAKNLDPKNFKELLLIRGMGKKKIRALALTANLVYGTELDWKDPVKYTFAHGGKDGTPFPVDKKLYDETITFFSELIRKSEKRELAKRLMRVFR